MADFTIQITNFLKNGTFDYQFDSEGNVILNTSPSVFQQNYLSLPLKNINYNNGKLLSFYDPTFTEFVAPPTSSIDLTSTNVLDQINALTAQNQELQDQLDQVIALNEISDSAANRQAVQSILIALRIQLGQGLTADDFQSTFPYLPIPLENQ